MVRDGIPYLIIFGALTAAGVLFGWNILGGVFLLLGLFCAYFFRNPRREPPNEPNIVLSPADGRVSKVGPLDPANPRSAQLVSIFLSPLDVHVNRAPIAGSISDITYTKGRFVNAMSEKASLVNEQNMVTVANDSIE